MGLCQTPTGSPDRGASVAGEARFTGIARGVRRRMLCAAGRAGSSARSPDVREVGDPGGHPSTHPRSNRAGAVLAHGNTFP